MQHNATHLGDLAVTTQVKQLRGFVSAPAGTDLSQLLEALKENNIHILDPARFAPGAVKITDKIIDGISNADLVIAVLGTATSSGNVLFELGCASALGKKTLVIVPEGYEIPSDIKDLVYIRTTPNNREAINFALEQVINAPEHETNQKARLLDKSKPLGDLADDLLKRLDSLGETPAERDIEGIVQGMLEASGVETRTQPKYPDIHPDFAVWIDELEPYFGNPILIEVKRQIDTDRQAKYVVEQVLHYMSLSNVKAVIVFAAQISSEAMKVASSYPNLYFFDLHDFLKRLRQESLGHLIRNERNARFHGILR
jgi:nucleoside 2-deoxyribosyltransferase